MVLSVIIELNLGIKLVDSGHIITYFLLMNKKKTHFNKRAFIIVLSLITALFLTWKIYNKLKQGSASGPGGGSVAVAVEIAPVKKGSLRDIASHTGTLQAKTRVVVAPKIAARLNKLLVDIGDPVRSGQLLAILEDEEYRQQVLQAEADLNVTSANLKEARSSLIIAEKNLERAQTLHRTGIQSDSQLDQVGSEYQSQLARVNVAEAQLANREAALANARVRLSYTRISAEWDRGNPLRYIGERFADEGALLSTNTPILSIVELHSTTAVINVTDQEYFRLKVGQAAIVSSTVYPGKEFPGRILRIAPLLQETSRQARVEIEVENQELLLKPGMFITVLVEFMQRDDITIVPFNALAKRNGEQGVFVVNIEAQNARFQPVETGIIEKGQVEIIRPTDISGYVVVMGHYLLETEGRVILPKNTPGIEPRSSNGEKAK